MRAQKGLFKGAEPDHDDESPSSSHLFPPSLLLRPPLAPDTSAAWFGAARRRQSSRASSGTTSSSSLASCSLDLPAVQSASGSLKARGRRPRRREFSPSYFGWFSDAVRRGNGHRAPVFWSVAEPIFHFQDNPFLERWHAGDERRCDARHAAHVLPLGPPPLGDLRHRRAVPRPSSAHRRKLPLSIRSVLYPLIGGESGSTGSGGHAVGRGSARVRQRSSAIATSLGFGRPCR